MVALAELLRLELSMMVVAVEEAEEEREGRAAGRLLMLRLAVSVGELAGLVVTAACNWRHSSGQRRANSGYSP